MRVSQSEFRTAMMAPGAPVPAGLCDGCGRGAGKRFDVYRNNVVVSLTEALITGFPTIYSLLGDAFFRAMAAIYVRQHPPSSPLMMYYGEALPAFLSSFPPVAHLPYLSDVAAVDLALRRAYHAKDVKTLDAASLAAMDPDRIEAQKFILAPAVAIIRSPYPIHSIRARTTGGPKPPAQAQDVVIARPDFDPTFDLLSPGMAVALMAFAKGALLSEALEQAQAEAPAFDLGSLVTLALLRGLLTTPSLT